MRLVLDIETDGRHTSEETRDPDGGDMTKIHCAVAYDLDLDEYVDFPPDSIGTLIAELNQATLIVTHGGTGFDHRVIKQFFPEYEVPHHPRAYDTLVVARLQLAHVRDTDWRRVNKGILDKDLVGSHSLKAWGQRLGMPKGEQPEDFKTFTPEMLEYCRRDVEVTTALYRFLEGRGWPG